MVPKLKTKKYIFTIIFTDCEEVDETEEREVDDDSKKNKNKLSSRKRGTRRKKGDKDDKRNDVDEIEVLFVGKDDAVDTPDEDGIPLSKAKAAIKSGTGTSAARSVNVPAPVLFKSFSVPSLARNGPFIPYMPSGKIVIFVTARLLVAIQIVIQCIFLIRSISFNSYISMYYRF